MRVLRRSFQEARITGEGGGGGEGMRIGGEVWMWRDLGEGGLIEDVGEGGVCKDIVRVAMKGVSTVVIWDRTLSPATDPVIVPVRLLRPLYASASIGV
jgi:hypothetical protein